MFFGRNARLVEANRAVFIAYPISVRRGPKKGTTWCAAQRMCKAEWLNDYESGVVTREVGSSCSEHSTEYRIDSSHRKCVVGKQK
jgi:hypothetical protein